MPHVVVKTEGNTLPDRTYEEAARLAGFYSKGRENEKVEIDYQHCTVYPEWYHLYPHRTTVANDSAKY